MGKVHTDSSPEEYYHKFVNGDKDAFYFVIDAYRESLIFFIKGFVKNEDTAEELAADCFVELIVKPQRFSFGSSLKTYLFSIARNKAVSFIRRNSKITLLSEQSVSMLREEYVEFEDTILRDEKSRMVNDALKGLKEDYQVALHLTYFEEMSYKEAASVMNKSVKQIENLVTRGKAALKKSLEKEGFVYED